MPEMGEQELSVGLVEQTLLDALQTGQRFGVTLTDFLRVASDNLLETAVLGHRQAFLNTLVPRDVRFEMACDVNNREGSIPLANGTPAGRTFHSSAAGRRRGAILADESRSRQSPHRSRPQHTRKPLAESVQDVGDLGLRRTGVLRPDAPPGTATWTLGTIPWVRVRDRAIKSIERRIAQRRQEDPLKNDTLTLRHMALHDSATKTDRQQSDRPKPPRRRQEFRSALEETALTADITWICTISHGTHGRRNRRKHWSL